MSGISSDCDALAFRLRRHWPTDRPALYHGTRYASSILAGNVLLAVGGGSLGVSLTRRPEVAVYWASLERDDCEGRGTVLVLDRDALRARYRIVPFRDPVWDGNAGGARRRYDEAEEAVDRDVVDLSRYLLAAVSIEP